MFPELDINTLELNISKNKNAPKIKSFQEHHHNDIFHTSVDETEEYMNLIRCLDKNYY